MYVGKVANPQTGPPMSSQLIGGAAFAQIDSSTLVVTTKEINGSNKDKNGPFLEYAVL